MTLARGATRHRVEKLNLEGRAEHEEENRRVCCDSRVLSRRAWRRFRWIGSSDQLHRGRKSGTASPSFGGGRSSTRLDTAGTRAVVWGRFRGRRPAGVLCDPGGIERNRVGRYRVNGSRLSEELRSAVLDTPLFVRQLVFSIRHPTEMLVATTRRGPYRHPDCFGFSVPPAELLRRVGSERAAQAWAEGMRPRREPLRGSLADFAK